MTTQEELHLLAQVRADNHTAFRTLFDAYYKYLLVISYRYVKEEMPAKDLAQDVFVELWNKRANLTINTSLKAYLRMAVVNKSLNYIKRAKRTSADEPTDALLGDTGRVGAQEELEASDLQSIVQQTVEGLPNRCRTIFQLSRYEELSHKEIATKLDISTKTVENQITRALKVLRAAIEKSGVLAIILLLVGG